MPQEDPAATERVDTELLARGLGRVVVVTHPTFNGRLQEWRVEIDTIELRRTTDLATGAVIEVVSFRGPTATGDGWIGRKTFFAAQCRRLVDVASGDIVEHDVAAWLTRLAASAAPR